MLPCMFLPCSWMDLSPLLLHLSSALPVLHCSCPLLYLSLSPPVLLQESCRTDCPHTRWLQILLHILLLPLSCWSPCRCLECLQRDQPDLWPCLQKQDLPSMRILLLR